MDNTLAMLMARKGGGADWNASEGEDGYVKNRTHYEAEELVSEPLNITWDGNPDGLDELVYTQIGENYFFKVSSRVLTDEQIKLATINTTFDGSVPIVEAWNYWLEKGFVTEGAVYAYYAVFVREAGAEVNGVVFPEAGVYAVFHNGDYAYSITTTEPIAQTKTVVKKLDKKYLPDDVGGSVTAFYVSFDDNYLYHDKETTMKVSKDEYRLALSSGVVTIATPDDYSVFYPSYSDFADDYASVSLWDDGDWVTVHTSEKASASPV